VNLTITIDSLEGFGESLLTWAESIRHPVQSAMAIALLDVTLENFGDYSIHRTTEWQPLRRGYADKFHDGDTTPTEILTGALKESYQVDLFNPDASRVFSDCPYAADQHNGVPASGPFSVSIPPRPVLPISEGDELDVYAEALIRGAAEAAIAELLPK
jgi:hypothetical protein